MPETTPESIHPRRRRWWFKPAISGFTGLVALLGLELGARALAAVNGRPYSAHQSTLRARELVSSLVDELPRPGDDAGTTDTQNSQTIVHPFLGWDAPFGFRYLEEDLAALEARQPDDYWVLVVGGSVSNRLVTYASAELVRALEGVPALRGKKPRVLNYARAAFKQPQQLVMVAYLLSLGLVPDMVVNIDGYNELTVSDNNVRGGAHPVYPAYKRWLAALGSLQMDSTSLNLLLQLQDSRLAAEALLRRAEQTGWMHSCLAGRWTLSRLESRLATGRRLEKELSNRMTGDSIDPRRFGPRHDMETMERSQLFELFARTWEESSLSLMAICKERSIPYFHVLQPALHDLGSKVLTPEEQEYGERTSKKSVAAIQGGYPLLREASVRLRARGVPFVDASLVFADTEETVYYDACHQREDGCRIFMRFIGERIAEYLGN